MQMYLCFFWYSPMENYGYNGLNQSHHKTQYFLRIWSFLKLLILIKLKLVESIIIRRIKPKIRIHSRKILGQLSLAYALRNIINRKALYAPTQQQPFSLPFSSPTYFQYFVGATSTNSLMIKLQPKIYDCIMLIVRILFVPISN